MGMGKVRSNASPIWNYFDVTNVAEKRASCKFCKNTLSFKSTITNLKYHLRKLHSDVYEEFFSLDQIDGPTGLQAPIGYEESGSENEKVVYEYVVANSPTSSGASANEGNETTFIKTTDQPKKRRESRYLSTEQRNSTNQRPQGRTSSDQFRGKRLIEQLTQEKINITSLQKDLVEKELEEKNLKVQLLQNEMEHKKQIYEVEKCEMEQRKQAIEMANFEMEHKKVMYDLEKQEMLLRLELLKANIEKVKGNSNLVVVNEQL